MIAKRMQNSRVENAKTSNASKWHFWRGKTPFGYDDLSAEPTQGRDKIIDHREMILSRRGAAPIVVEWSSLVTNSVGCVSLLA